MELKWRYQLGSLELSFLLTTLYTLKIKVVGHIKTYPQAFVPDFGQA